MPLAELLPIVAAATAGIAWSTIGIWEKLRNREPNVTIDFKKLGKNVALGSGIGIATYVYASIEGNPEPLITSLKTFALAVGLYFPLVIIVDKLLIGKKPN